MRLARFSVVSGNVTWRADSTGDWAKATINLPIRQGAQISVMDSGKADIQFDDGSELRLGNGAVATLKVLYSDKDGEFTQISLNDGLATLRSRHDNAVYQVDTPAVSVKTKGSSQVRFGVDSGTEVTVQIGEATVEGPKGKINLRSGDYLDLTDPGPTYKVRSAPPADNWDRWNEERNGIMEGGAGHVPPNIGLVSGDLNGNGTWRDDPAYGWLWYPREGADWRPYYDGSWTWCDPFGWTWVSNEPWGWAPYHYGTWVHQSYGWGWCPGPLHQYWCPAVVDFSVYDGCVAWAPLCPLEVRYPSAFEFGFWGPSWGFSFSIGCCGCYYPFGGYCVGRRFDNHFVNNFHGRGIHGGFSPSFDRFSRTNEFAAANSHFVPFNATHGGGASFTKLASFGSQGRFQALGAWNTRFFSQGRSAAVPGAGQSPVAGPPRVAPTALSRTPTHSIASSGLPSQAALNRSVYHASTPISGRQSGLAGAAGRTGARSPLSGSSRVGGANSAGAAGARSSSASALPGNRGSVFSNPSRSSANSGSITRQPSLGSSGQADSLNSSRRSTLGNSGARLGDSRSSAAEAARAARSSVGYIYGNSSPSSRGSGATYGSSSRSGARSGSGYGVYGDRSGSTYRSTD